MQIHWSLRYPFSIFTALLFCLALFGCFSEQPDICLQEPLLRFMTDGRWGFLDLDGQVVVPPKYDLAYEYTDSMSLVVLKGMFGFVNEKGEEAIPTRYANALNFTEGHAAVLVGNKWGYIDKSGATRIEPQFDAAWQFSDGLAAVYRDGLGGYIDHDGNSALEFKYGWAGNFQEGLAPVRLPGEGMAVIDKTGRTVIGPKLEYAGKHQDGLVPICKDGSCRFVDREGNSVIELPASVVIADPYREGFAKVNTNDDRWGMFSSWGYVNRRGQLVVGHQYDEATDFSESLAAVNFSREYTTSFSLDKGMVTQPRALWGYINSSGETVIEPQFTSAERFKCGIALVIIGSEAGYIDKNGKYLWNLAGIEPATPAGDEDVIWFNTGQAN